MTDDRARQLLALQQELADIEADLPTARPSSARALTDRLTAARAELAALVGDGTIADIRASEDATIAGSRQQAPRTGAAALGISGSGHNHDNTQIVGDVTNNYFGDQRPERGDVLLAHYLDSLVRMCQELRLERIQRTARDGNEQQRAPALKLNEVYAELTTTDPPIVLHERQGQRGRLRALWERYVRRCGGAAAVDPAYASAPRVRTPHVSLVYEERKGISWRDIQVIESSSHVDDEEVFDDRDPLDDEETALTILRPELVIDAVRAEPRLVLLGEPGSGKSTVLRWLATQLALAAQGRAANPLGDGAPPVPVVLALGQLDDALRDPKAKPAEVLLAALGSELNGIDGLTTGLSQHLRPALRHGGVILLLDGLDELPATPAGRHSPRARAAEGIRELATRHRLRIVVTSRVAPYREPGDWKLTDADGWAQRTIAPLAFGQVRTFVQSWYVALARRAELTDPQATAAADELIAQLTTDRHSRTRDLLQTPLLLTMLTVLHYNGLRAGRPLPTERAELYEQCVELLLHRWEPVRTPGITRKGLLDMLETDDRVTLAAVRDLVNELAFCAHHRASDASARGRLSRRELDGRLKEFFTQYRQPTTDGVDRVERFCTYIAQEVGLLQAEGDNQFVFPHLTFQEYLAACYAAQFRTEPAQRADDRILDPQLTVEALLRRCWNGADGERWRILLTLLAERFNQSETALLRDHGLPWIEALAARDIGGVPRDVPERLRDAELAVLSYDAVGRDASLVRTGRSRDSVEHALRGAILDLLDTPDARVLATSRVLAAQILTGLTDGDPRPYLPDRPGFWCDIPAGPFWFGDDSENALKHVDLSYAYKIARYPVTTALYAEFIAANSGAYDPARDWWTDEGRTFLAPGGHRWDDQEQPILLPRLWNDSRYNGITQPVVGVSWYEAAAFCRWLTAHERAAGRLGTDAIIRLPTSLEWERAARGTDQRRYPWGPEDPTPEHANYKATGIGAPSPVGCFPRGRAASGADDMAGNVMEWLATPYKKDNQVTAEKDFTPDSPVRLSGSAYWREVEHLSCGARYWDNPFDWINRRGFRIVWSFARDSGS